MKTAFVFDVDGTLTDSRALIDPTFKSFFAIFCKTNDVYIVTGSDQVKTLEQLGSELYDMPIRVYQCSGNDVYEESEQIWVNEWELDDTVTSYLENTLLNNNFLPKTGGHIDIRPGLVNFSIVGRGATVEERALYVEHDTLTNERSRIATEFNELFADEFDIIASVAGETGIDITLEGHGKEQILDDLDEYDRVVFFGDKTAAGGNDFEIARDLLADNQTVHAVVNWQNTYEILSAMYVE